MMKLEKNRGSCVRNTRLGTSALEPAVSSYELSFDAWARWIRMNDSDAPAMLGIC